MKEVADPIAGNILLVRNFLGNIGIIESVYEEYGYLMVKMHWILNPAERQQTETDHAYPIDSGRENFYIYLDCKDTPQNRLAVQLKYVNV